MYYPRHNGKGRRFTEYAAPLKSYRFQKFMAYFLAVVAVGGTICLIWLLALMVLAYLVVKGG